MPESETTPELIDSAKRLVMAVAGAPAEEQAVMLESFVRNVQARAHRDAQERFAVLYQHCPVGVVLADPDGMIGAANPAFLRQAQLDSEAELLGTPAEGLGVTDRDRVLLRTALESGADVVDPVTIGSSPQDARVVRVTVSTVPGERGRYPILMIEDTHELRQLRETLQHQSLHDPLTGLPNGTHFRSRLEACLADRERQPVLLYFDIDGFKVVNDGLGAEAADSMLLSVAGTLRAVFAPYDGLVARLFGDRFAVILREGVTSATAADLAEQVISELGKPVYVTGVGVGVSASAGIAIADTPGTGHEALMRAAEVALHRAKELGKAQWVLFDPKMGQTDHDRYRLASAIAGALEVGEIAVQYRPHVVLPNAEIVTSLNAVPVWNHPTRGTLPATEFYPLAEITGMTVPLGRHLLAEALRARAHWRSRFDDGAPMVCLTLPGRMAVDADLVGIVRTELDRCELTPHDLMLCADTQSLVDERGDLLESLGHLAGLGVVFVINISGLPDLELVAAREVPAPAVMLTGPIVDVLAAEEPPQWCSRNVRQLVERAEELGIKVGAHGVSSQTQAQRLFELGVVVAAGSYQPEYLDPADAEVWAGKVFPMG